MKHFVFGGEISLFKQNLNFFQIEVVMQSLYFRAKAYWCKKSMLESASLSAYLKRVLLLLLKNSYLTMGEAGGWGASLTCQISCRASLKKKKTCYSSCKIIICLLIKIKHLNKVKLVIRPYYPLPCCPKARIQHAFVNITWATLLRSLQSSFVFCSLQR